MMISLFLLVLQALFKQSVVGFHKSDSKVSDFGGSVLVFWMNGMN